MAGILEKILIQELRGIKCKKFGLLDIFLDTDHKVFLICCMMIEGNKAHHLTMMPHLGKILIRD